MLEEGDVRELRPVAVGPEEGRAAAVLARTRVATPASVLRRIISHFWRNISQND